MESTAQNTITEEVSVQKNNNKPNNNSITNFTVASIENEFLQQPPPETDIISKNTTLTTPPKIFKRPSWDDMVAENMHIDEEDKASVSSEFLRNITAENTTTAENSNDKKGKSKNPDELINDDSFIKIFKPTKYVTFIILDDVKGNSP